MEHSAFPLALLVELFSLSPPVALGRWLGGILDAPRNGRPGLLRRRLGALDDAAGAVGGSATGERRQVSEEIEPAREEAAGRHGTTVNALETLRLELPRARAGLGGSDGLTGNLAELRRVADQIDAALETRKR